MAEPEPANCTVGALSAEVHVISGWNRRRYMYVITECNSETALHMKHVHIIFIHIV